MKTKIILLVFLLLGSFLKVNCEEKWDTDWPENEKIRILAVGNSFSEDAVEQYLYELCKDAGIEAVIGNLYIQSCSLKRHWENVKEDKGEYSYRKILEGVRSVQDSVKLESAIEDEKWDIITLQQVSQHSGMYSTYDPYLNDLIEWIKERSDAQIWFHQTWAYPEDSKYSVFEYYDWDQIVMYNAIVDAVKKAIDDHPDLIDFIPSGTAVQNMRTSYVRDKMCRDSYHLEKTYGRYTAACTWFEKLTGKDVRDNNYYPETIDLHMKETVQRCVHDAILNPYEITESKDSVYITLNTYNEIINIGDSFQLEAKVLPEILSDKIIWETSDPGIVEVDERTGLVKAICEGSAKVKATYGETAVICEIDVLGYDGLESNIASGNSIVSIYSIEGILLKKDCYIEELKNLPKGIYIIVNGNENYKISLPIKF